MWHAVAWGLTAMAVYGLCSFEGMTRLVTLEVSEGCTADAVHRAIMAQLATQATFTVESYDEETDDLTIQMMCTGPRLNVVTISDSLIFVEVWITAFTVHPNVHLQSCPEFRVM